MLEDAAAPRAEAPDDAAAAVPVAPPKPENPSASAMPPDEELAAMPYVYPLLRKRLMPEMR